MAFRQRVQSGLQTLMQSDFTNVLVVAHRGILNQAIQDLLQASPESIFCFSDTAFAQLLPFRDSHSVILKGVDLAPHLETNATEALS